MRMTSGSGVSLSFDSDDFKYLKHTCCHRLSPVYIVYSYVLLLCLCCITERRHVISEHFGGPPSEKQPSLSTNFKVQPWNIQRRDGLKGGIVYGSGVVSPQVGHSIVKVDFFLVDRTLSLLITSAQSRGLAHKLTRNLSFLHFCFQRYQERTRYFSATGSWDPHQQEYKPVRPARSSQIQAERFHGQCWGALEETARMAEGKSGLTLGSVEFRLRRP